MHPENLIAPVIYEVFPRNHGDEDNLRNIADDLKRIQALGVDIVWLMPHYPIGTVNRKGSKGSPYSILDYRSIHPDFGTAEDFQYLADCIHELGMKLMIDIVYNHTAHESVLARMHPDWFLKDKSDRFTCKEPDWSDVIDLDYGNPDLWEYQIETLVYWSGLGVDGFRCDVAPLVPIEFWEDARNRLEGIKPIIWLAESVHKSYVKHLRRKGYRCHSDPELHAAFDFTYDYDGFEYLEDYFAGRVPISSYLDYLYIQETLYPAGAGKLRFVENHDIPRIASRIGHPNELLNWSVFYQLLPGASLIYEGQEYADPHLPALFEKDATHRLSQDLSFTDFFGNAVRKCKIIRNSCHMSSIREVSPDVVEIIWTGNDVRYLGVVQLKASGGYNYRCSGTGTCLLSEATYNLNQGVKAEDLPILLKMDN